MRKFYDKSNQNNYTSFLVMLLCGCKSDIIIADKPLKEKDVIGYVQNEIYEKNGDETKVRIINKTNKENIATGKYEDGYIKYDDSFKKSVTPRFDYHNFEYLVFRYGAEPNSFIGYNSPTIEIYGVK